VVRVAGPNARAARWRVPGLRRWYPNGILTDVYVDAAWVGAWSEGLEVGTQLLEQPLSPAGAYVPGSANNPGTVALRAASAQQLFPGDLLRLDLGTLYPGVLVLVGSITSAGLSHGWTVTAAAEVPFLADASPPLPGTSGAVTVLPASAIRGLGVSVPIVGVSLLRMDLMVQQLPPAGGPPQQLEQRTNLALNPVTLGRGGATPVVSSWLDVIQQGAVPPPVPDISRSLLLRADGPVLDDGGVYVPVAMDELGTGAEFMDAISGSLPDSGVWAGDDDLSSFDPIGLFLDPNMLHESVYDLVEDANELTVLSPEPIELRGVHSLVGVDEVAMIAVPDAVHIGWTKVEPVAETGHRPTPTPEPPVDWSRFECCDQTPPPPPPPPAPPVVPTAPPAPLLNPVAGYDPGPLFAVQRALVTLCAARADAVAVLSVPQHFQTADVLTWCQELTTDGEVSGPPLSFAGIWHPWVQEVEPTTPKLAPLRPLPPDGPVCGVIAAQEASKGAWVAPANVPLRGVVDVTPVVATPDLLTLFNAHVNLLAHQPGSFTTLSAHTLSSDPALLQLSVRRLLILLRKLCLDRGMRYVFEPNTDRFRQMVQISFRRLLTELTQLGAMLNFSVVTDCGVNTQNEIANGELIVQLLVAPTSPVEFITVTLVRAGEGLLDVLGP
jgi:hypothetical protein